MIWLGGQWELSGKLEEDRGGGVELKDDSKWTGLFPGGPGGTHDGPGDDGHCHESCLRGEHLRLTMTTLVEVISLPLWPIPLKLSAYAGG